MWEIKSCNKSDECYPKHLRELSSSPDVLYYVGDISVCDSIIIAIIGKRDVHKRYLEIARQYGELLAKKGYTVLNGLAVGCDTHALEGAIAANGRTIAVMPSGLDEIYPKSNQKLAEKIIENGGCLISEYPNGTKPQKYTFVQRDRIQAILSNKVLVVATEKDGGTMHTVDYARKFAKPLGCYVEDESDIMAGNRMLIDKKIASAVSDTNSLMMFVEEPEYTQMSFI